jgi:anti-anti-sigma factor
VQCDVKMVAGGKALVVRLQGVSYVGHCEAAKLFQAIDREIQDNPECDLILDCNSLENASSSFFAEIIRLQQMCKRANRQITLVTSAPGVLNFLAMTQINKKIMIAPNVKTAMSMMGLDA